MQYNQIAIDIATQMATFFSKAIIHPLVIRVNAGY
jgi:hypothetical protein